MTEHDTVARDRRRDWLLMNALHDAFRRDLDQLMHSTAAAASIRARWQIFRGQLHFHHTAEDTAMWPPVRARLASMQDPAGLALLDEMEAEHAQIGPLLAAVDDALTMNAGRERLRELLGRTVRARLIYRAVWLPRYRRRAAAL